MKKFLALLLAIAFIAMATAPWGSTAQNKGNERGGQPNNLKFRRVKDKILDQYIVVLKDDVPAAEVSSRAANLVLARGGFTRHVYKSALKGFAATMRESEAIALSKDPSQPRGRQHEPQRQRANQPGYGGQKLR